MVRRRRQREEAAAVRVCPAAQPPSSEDDEAPEELSFGTARAEAEAARKLAGEAARRHRELLKEKRRRRQELFTEQKVPRSPRGPPRSGPAVPRAITANGVWGYFSAVEFSLDKPPKGGSAKQSEDRVPGQAKKDKARGTRSKGNYIAVHLKDQSLTGLHQQTARDFIYSQLYGPGTNRTSGMWFPLGLHLDLSVLNFVINAHLITANEFFSIANKKDTVKKAAVQFVDKSWGIEKKQRATKFTKYWVARKVTNTL
ncbi:NOL7 protein, partial [Odontophorus gujanensis]|nr:NOL7 protein [Odontophorus gujanensis]